MSIPGDASPLLLGSGAQQYKIERSLRFNSSDSAYLSRTPASAGNRKTWTWSGWVKLGALGTVRQIFTSRTSSSPYALFYIFSDDKISFADNTLNTHTTAAVYRDPSAWYHIQLTVDTTDATSANRVRLWVNGTLQTWASTTAPTQNADGQINTATAHSIGSPQPYASSEYFSGYLADIHFIDGQALTPSSFAETNTTTGQWVPKAYTGTYGTNGFRLAFADNSNNTATTLGKDTSGNGNNWTPNNLSVTAGSGNDSLVDTPTSYGTDDFLGGSVRGNYCTLNPLQSGSGSTLTNGNLDIQATQNGGQTLGTIGVSSGKWYFEGTVTAYAGNEPDPMIGISSNSNPLTTNYPGQSSSSYAIYCLKTSSLIQKVNNGTFTNTGTTQVALNDVISIAFDLDSGKFWASKNGVWIDSGNPAAGTNALFSGITGSFLPSVRGAGSTSTAGWSLNFGQRPFAYTAPSGFKALCDTNLPAPVVAKPNSVFDVKLYTGNGSTQTISGLGFSPDLVWLKSRNTGVVHLLYDSVRGAGALKSLQSNTTNAEAAAQDDATNGFLSAFTSDGFSVNAGTTNFYTNNSSTNYVSWAFDAGSNTVTNTQGSITSQVRANASAGFSIVTYTGTSSSQSVGHGLNVAPSLIITKNRSAALSWGVYHSSLGANNYLVLDVTNAVDNAPGVWGTVNSSVFGIGNFNINGKSNPYVAYCFAPVAGYSSFGSYTGNGNTSGDGPFVFCGFRPRYVLIRNVSRTENWIVHDTARDPYNVTTAELIPNSSGAEGNTTPFDILSNGFKIRNTTTNTGINASNETHIYCAFAENSFQYARAR